MAVHQDPVHDQEAAEAECDHRRRLPRVCLEDAGEAVPRARGPRVDVPRGQRVLKPPGQCLPRAWLQKGRHGGPTAGEQA